MRQLWVFVAVLLMLTVAATAEAGLVYGTVSGPNGGLIPNVSFVVQTLQGVQVASLTSNGQGRYDVTLPPGTYRVVRSGLSDVIRSRTTPWQQNIRFRKNP